MKKTIDPTVNRLYSYNPANLDEIIWEGQFSSEKTIVASYKKAKESLNTWSLLDVNLRINHLQQFATILNQKKDELTKLIALESGKPIWEAATETQSVIAKVELSIQAFHERTGEKLDHQGTLNQCLRYKPHGVVVVLGAFNFPAHLSNGHIVPAVLAGNTILYKPSELTPAVGEFMVNCWHESGLPEGVIQLIQGDANTAKILFEQDIQGVYFTGSYRAGVAINRYFSERPEVILALEMGGNNPLIIDENIHDFKAAVYHTILSSFLTAGQRCTCARRLMIPDTDFGQTYLEHLIETTKNLQIGSAFDEQLPFMGPVIREHHAKEHLRAQEHLIKIGGVSLLKMQHLKQNTGFLSPGIIDVTHVPNTPDQEVFAPFLQVYRYKNFEEALILANQTQYGLAAALFSENQNHYERFYQSTKAGLINWNRPTTGALSRLPFGGIGHSGNHRPSAYFAADYCAYPIASLEESYLNIPETLLPGITL